MPMAVEQRMKEDANKRQPRRRRWIGKSRQVEPRISAATLRTKCRESSDPRWTFPFHVRRTKGGLAVLHQAWDSLALGRLFSSVNNARTAGLLKAMVIGRVLFPSAKLALVDHARGTLLAAACGLDQANEDFDEDDLYDAMDELTGQHSLPIRQLGHRMPVASEPQAVASKSASCV